MRGRGASARAQFLITRAGFAFPRCQFVSDSRSLFNSRHNWRRDHGLAEGLIGLRAGQNQNDGSGGCDGDHEPGQ